MKDLFSKASNLSDAIFGSGNAEPQKLSASAPEKREWDFGSMQAKVTAESGKLTWSLLGNGGATYPLSSVRGVQYEKGHGLTWMSHIIFLVSGGDNKKIQVPKSEASEKTVESINLFISRFHEKEQQPQVAPATINSFLIADELTKLADLRQKGILTEEEFQQQKHKLLNR